MRGDTLSGNPSPNKRIELPNSSVAWSPCAIGDGLVNGDKCSIGALAHIGRNVTMGNNCRIQGSAYIADDCKLGNNVFIGPNAALLNDRYPPSGDKALWQPITVGNGAVIGGGATVVPGCNVGENAVLGAGSVLTKPLPSNEVWVGNPAVFLMTRKNYDAKR